MRKRIGQLLFLTAILLTAACSPVKKEDKDAGIQQNKKKNGIEEMKFIGEWIHVGEMTHLSIFDNRKCEISIIDELTPEGDLIKGNWQIKGNQLTIKWERDWTYTKNGSMILEYKKTGDEDVLDFMPSDNKKMTVEKELRFIKETN